MSSAWDLMGMIILKTYTQPRKLYADYSAGADKDVSGIEDAVISDTQSKHASAKPYCPKLM